MTTRLLVLADTHMPRRGVHLPSTVHAAAQTVDMIAHLGDFTDASVVAQLRALRPLIAVHGNNDTAEVRRLLPSLRRVQIEHFSLVLLHGHLGGRTALAAARAVESADIILFGHSHRALAQWENGRLLFNPGSPTDRRWGPTCSYGILEIGEEIYHRIMPID